MDAKGVVLWLLIAVGLFVLETATYQLISIWFAVGALLAALAVSLGAPLWGQVLVFLVSSIAVLIIARTALKDRLKVKKAPTNADRLIGQTGVVKEEINNELETGRVFVGGLSWMARNDDEGVIAPETLVIIQRIEGAKLLVKPQEAPIEIVD